MHPDWLDRLPWGNRTLIAALLLAAGIGFGWVWKGTIDHATWQRAHQDVTMSKASAPTDCATKVPWWDILD
jgi:hypothetical protein